MPAYWSPFVQGFLTIAPFGVVYLTAAVWKRPKVAIAIALAWSLFAGYQLWRGGPAWTEGAAAWSAFRSFDGTSWVLLVGSALLGLATSLGLSLRQWHSRPGLRLTAVAFGLAGTFLGTGATLALQDNGLASEACANGDFQVVIGNARVRVPARTGMKIYLGDTLEADRFFLSEPRMLAALCKRTADGQRPVTASLVTTDFVSRTSWCTNRPLDSGSEPAWAAEYCRSISNPAQSWRVPPRVALFDPARISSLEEFGVSRSTHEDRLAGTGMPADIYVVSSRSKSPDGNPLTGRCRVGDEGAALCRVAYGWSGAALSYMFVTDIGRFDLTAEAIDASVRSFILRHGGIENAR